MVFFSYFQARATSALSTREGSVSALKNCWEILKCESISFVTLVTGAFPPPKVCMFNIFLTTSYLWGILGQWDILLLNLTFIGFTNFN